jgi:hypothetical protein
MQSIHSLIAELKSIDDPIDSAERAADYERVEGRKAFKPVTAIAKIHKTTVVPNNLGSNL